MNKSGNKSFSSKEDMMKMTCNQYADELFDRKEYDKAEENYKKSGNIKGLTNCYFAKEEYENAAKMFEVIPEEDEFFEFLEEMGEKFLGLGMFHETVIACNKHGNIKKGIETYIGCVLTGGSILDNHYFKCKQYRNKTIKSEVKKKPFKHCPLCHIVVIEKNNET